MHPSLKFLLKFGSAYLFGNLLYWIIIDNIKPDPFTQFAAYLLDVCFSSISTQLRHDASGFIVLLNKKAIVNLAEGCNGMAIWITLVSFCIAFGGKLKSFIWYIPSSYAMLQIGNILRLWILVQIKTKNADYFPLFHEYIFPAILYGIAFLIMVFWVKYQNNLSKTSK